MAQNYAKIDISNHSVIQGITKKVPSLEGNPNKDLILKESTTRVTILKNSKFDIPSFAVIGGGNVSEKYLRYLKSGDVGPFAMAFLTEIYLKSTMFYTLQFCCFRPKHIDAMAEAWMKLLAEWMPQVKQLAEPGKHLQHEIPDDMIA